MSHVLTVKMPHPLMDRLEDLSKKEGRSKGAVVREAVENHLKEGSAEEAMVARIKKITEAHRLGKPVKSRVDWDKLCEKAAAPAGMTLEEEMERFRRRGM